MSHLVFLSVRLLNVASHIPSVGSFGLDGRSASHLPLFLDKSENSFTTERLRDNKVLLYHWVKSMNLVGKGIDKIVHRWIDVLGEDVRQMVVDARTLVTDLYCERVKPLEDLFIRTGSPAAQICKALSFRPSGNASPMAGSPNITSALTLSKYLSGSVSAARCITPAPWLYPIRAKV